MIKLGHTVLKGVNWVDNDKIRSNDVERSQLGTQYKNTRSYGLERIQLGTQYKYRGCLLRQVIFF